MNVKIKASSLSVTLLITTLSLTSAHPHRFKRDISSEVVPMVESAEALESYLAEHPAAVRVPGHGGPPLQKGQAGIQQQGRLFEWVNQLFNGGSSSSSHSYEDDYECDYDHYHNEHYHGHGHHYDDYDGHGYNHGRENNKNNNRPLPPSLGQGVNNNNNNNPRPQMNGYVNNNNYNPNKNFASQPARLPSPHMTTVINGKVIQDDLSQFSMNLPDLNNLYPSTLSSYSFAL